MDSSGELMGFMNGGRVERRDRQVAAPAKRIHDEVREAAFKAMERQPLAHARRRSRSKTWLTCPPPGRAVGRLCEQLHKQAL
jgi:hypothetical protein